MAKLNRPIISGNESETKGTLAAKPILGVRIAVGRTAPYTSKSPPYRALSRERKPTLPLPLMNIINGGKHAGNDLSFQEIMVIPAGFRTFKDALRCGAEIYHSLRLSLEAKYGKPALNV